MQQRRYNRITEEKEENLEQLKIEDKKREDCKINSKIPENKEDKSVVILWTDNIENHVNDEIRIVIESNKYFDGQTKLGLLNRTILLDAVNIVERRKPDYETANLGGAGKSPFDNSSGLMPGPPWQVVHISL